jgi:putative ABC transport system ATP-binding protein
MLECLGLYKSYNEAGKSHTIFSDLNCQLETGEFVALLGRSGSGKTTLLNLISGIDIPDRGEVLIDGKALNYLSEKERTLFRRYSLGFVFQFFNLIPTLTVEENILLPLKLSNSLDKKAKQQVSQHLKTMGLSGMSEKFPEQLSGGEQQRIAIIRAVIHQPKLLLADEPTGNLDTETGEQVMEFFMQQLLQTGMTTLMVTHSREIAGRADRIWQLHQGQIQEMQFA